VYFASMAVKSEVARVGHIDRSHSPRLTQVTFKRFFGALKTQSLVLLRLTSWSTRQTSQKKVQ
jgi:hypothetical protein